MKRFHQPLFGILLTAICLILTSSIHAQEQAAMLPADMWPVATSPADAPLTAPIRVVYFHSPTCAECKRVKDFLPQVTERWGDRIVLELHNTDEAEGFREFLKYSEHYSINMIAPPMIFVGDKALEGDSVIMKQLNATIDNALARHVVTFHPNQLSATTAGGNAAPDQVQNQTPDQPVPGEIQRLFESFGPGAIVVAGLIDGVNPCAFTTIVFFLSMLAYLKKTRRDMVLVGAGFTIGMFVAYFLIGLGLLGAVKAFSVHHGLAAGLAYAVAVLAFALAGWSTFDALRYHRTGDVKQVTLGLPRKIKDKIHKVIRAGLTTRSLVIGSLSVGFFVSVLESLCTGQVYLPTIILINNLTRDASIIGDAATASSIRTTAIGYLLLYNVMFIVPLLAILALTYFGVRSETLGNLLRKRLAFAKFAMATLFAGLGLLVLFTV